MMGSLRNLYTLMPSRRPFSNAHLHRSQRCRFNALLPSEKVITRIGYRRQEMGFTKSHLPLICARSTAQRQLPSSKNVNAQGLSGFSQRVLLPVASRSAGDISISGVTISPSPSISKRPFAATHLRPQSVIIGQNAGHAFSSCSASDFSSGAPLSPITQQAPLHTA